MAQYLANDRALGYLLAESAVQKARVELQREGRRAPATGKNLPSLLILYLFAEWHKSARLAVQLGCLEGCSAGAAQHALGGVPAAKPFGEFGGLASVALVRFVLHVLDNRKLLAGLPAAGWAG